MISMNPDPSQSTPPPKRHPLEQEAPIQRPGDRPPPGLIVRMIIRVPYVTYTLIAINVIVFIVRAVSADVELQTLLDGANSARGVFQNGEWWRLFTSMFLHTGIHDYNGGGLNLAGSLHLIFNMVALSSSGALVERVNGHARFLAIYLLGGLSGALLSAAMGTQLSVGASGAVFGIFAAQLDFFLRHRPIFGAYGQAQIRSLTTLVLINLAMGLLVPRIDNWAHIGGALGGYLASRFGGARFVAQQDANTGSTLAQSDGNLRSSLTAFGALAILWMMAAILITLVNRG
jgi:membrane associated rhomboid family serine protease